MIWVTLVNFTPGEEGNQKSTYFITVCIRKSMLEEIFLYNLYIDKFVTTNLYVDRSGWRDRNI